MIKERKEESLYFTGICSAGRQGVISLSACTGSGAAESATTETLLTRKHAEKAMKENMRIMSSPGILRTGAKLLIKPRL